MKLITRLGLAVVALIAAFALAACGGGNTNSGASGGNSFTFRADGENLAFAPATASVAAGSVTLTFENTSAAQQHNLILVRDSASADKVANDGLAAGEAAGYIPDDPEILGHTQLLNPGQTGNFTVDLQPGTYIYICTVPGHYPLMQGTLTVQ